MSELTFNKAIKELEKISFAGNLSKAGKSKCWLAASSIIGDVPCFVDCVYFGNCDDDQIVCSGNLVVCVAYNAKEANNEESAK